MRRGFYLICAGSHTTAVAGTHVASISGKSTLIWRKPCLVIKGGWGITSIRSDEIQDIMLAHHYYA